MGLLWFLVILVSVAALVLAVLAYVRASDGGRGRRGRRGRTGSGETGSTGPTGGGSGGGGGGTSIALIPYGGFMDGFGFQGNSALVVTSLGQVASNVDVPIDPTNDNTLQILNSNSWANNGTATLRDLQIVLPTGDGNDQTGMHVIAQIWSKPCTGTWTGTALMASIDIPLFPEIFGGGCFNSGDLEIQSEAGDRIALILTTDTGFFNTNGNVGMSAGLGYLRTLT